MKVADDKIQIKICRYSDYRREFAFKWKCTAYFTMVWKQIQL